MISPLPIKSALEANLRIIRERGNQIHNPLVDNPSPAQPPLLPLLGNVPGIF